MNVCPLIKTFGACTGIGRAFYINMCVGRLGFCNFMVLIFMVIKNGSTDTHIENLLQLISKANVKPPYIAILYPQEKNIKDNDLQTEVDLTEDITPDIDSLDPPYDQKAYLLYHALRTTEERETLDPEAAIHFEQTKGVLRQVLRNRCNQLNLCFRECPKTIHIKCTIECRQTYDDYDVCQPVEQKCDRPRCGRTLPPSW